MTQLSNVPMQPNPSAVERPLTLIEKLELEKECWHDDGENNVHRVIDDCIDIVKQHQAESGWKHVKEKPTQRGRYLVCATDGKMFDCRYSQDCWHKNNIGYRDILYWMPLPQPPSEVQDD